MKRFVYLIPRLLLFIVLIHNSAPIFTQNADPEPKRLFTLVNTALSRMFSAWRQLPMQYKVVIVGTVIGVVGAGTYAAPRMVQWFQNKKKREKALDEPKEKNLQSEGKTNKLENRDQEAPGLIDLKSATDIQMTKQSSEESKIKNPKSSNLAQGSPKPEKEKEEQQEENEEEEQEEKKVEKVDLKELIRRLVNEIAYYLKDNNKDITSLQKRAQQLVNKGEYTKEILEEFQGYLKTEKARKTLYVNINPKVPLNTSRTQQSIFSEKTTAGWEYEKIKNHLIKELTNSLNKLLNIMETSKIKTSSALKFQGLLNDWLGLVDRKKLSNALAPWIPFDIESWKNKIDVAYEQIEKNKKYLSKSYNEHQATIAQYQKKINDLLQVSNLVGKHRSSPKHLSIASDLEERYKADIQSYKNLYDSIFENDYMNIPKEKVSEKRAWLQEYIEQHSDFKRNDLLISEEDAKKLKGDIPVDQVDTFNNFLNELYQKIFSYQKLPQNLQYYFYNSQLQRSDSTLSKDDPKGWLTYAYVRERAEQYINLIAYYDPQFAKNMVKSYHSFLYPSGEWATQEVYNQHVNILINIRDYAKQWYKSDLSTIEKVKASNDVSRSYYIMWLQLFLRDLLTVISSDELAELNRASSNTLIVYEGIVSDWKKDTITQRDIDGLKDQLADWIPYDIQALIRTLYNMKKLLITRKKIKSPSKKIKIEESKELDRRILVLEIMDNVQEIAYNWPNNYFSKDHNILFKSNSLIWQPETIIISPSDLVFVLYKISDLKINKGDLKGWLNKIEEHKTYAYEIVKQYHSSIGGYVNAIADKAVKENNEVRLNELIQKTKSIKIKRKYNFWDTEQEYFGIKAFYEEFFSTKIEEKKIIQIMEESKKRLIKKLEEVFNKVFALEKVKQDNIKSIFFYSGILSDWAILPLNQKDVKNLSEIMHDWIPYDIQGWINKVEIALKELSGIAK